MKDQFVIAYLADLSMTDAVVQHARLLAQMLKKGLILLYVEDKNSGGYDIHSVTPVLQQAEASVADVHPAHAALKGNTREIIAQLPTMLNGVVVVAGVNPSAPKGSATHPREVMRNFLECKIAYLTVQTAPKTSDPYRHVAYSVDFRKESKEKLIWASYFARFNRSTLHMLHFNYKDSGLRTKLNNNIKFMNNFFHNVGVEYQSQTVAGHAFFPERLICDAAGANGYDLLISVTTDTRERDMIEWFVGVHEDRTVRNAARMPVLYLNPRNDIYVLCD